MKSGKEYSWNRNVSHHRIALTRFGVFSFLSAFVAMMGVNLSMATIYDGTRHFVTVTMVIGFLGFLFTFLMMFLMMTVMYRWVCDLDRSRERPPYPTKVKERHDREISIYLQESGDYYLAGWGEVSTAVDSLQNKR